MQTIQKSFVGQFLQNITLNKVVLVIKNIWLDTVNMGILKILEYLYDDKILDKDSTHEVFE